ncbi:MAG TPA: NAD(P)-dependent oxidoreductase [Ilumatobacteraceae bacterium]|jgi:phosphoglycerate dehydrogenase-like enzyme
MPPSNQARWDRSKNAGPPRIAIGPHPEGGQHWLKGAIGAGGGHIVPVEDAEALIWTVPRLADQLEVVLEENEGISWVQLPYAGIEPFVHLVEDGRTWTCGKGIFAEPVAELALTLALAGLRDLGRFTRSKSWLAESGRNLVNGRVTILGGGGISQALVRMLRPFDCHITVVRNRVEEMEGVDEVLAAERYVDALAGADLVVLALPLTAETEEMISLTELEMMESHAWLINVARGKHIVTDDLVWALENGVIGGAGLDVTHPEPLPDDHPLWSLPNCIITPHVGATVEMEEPLLSGRISSNIRLFAQGQPLEGEVYPHLGY